jgi:hypothetical protein
MSEQLPAQYLWDRVLMYATEDRAKYPEWRVGQSMFNSLCIVCPVTADKIRGTVYDPYACDNRLPLFKERCFELWNMQNE